MGCQIPPPLPDDYDLPWKPKEKKSPRGIDSPLMAEWTFPIGAVPHPASCGIDSALTR